MRVIVFFLSFFFLLLGRGETVFASSNDHIITLSSAQFHQSKKQKEFSSENPSITLIDETDIDLEEDYHNSNNFKDKKYSRLDNQKISLLETKLSIHFCNVISNEMAMQFNVLWNKKLSNSLPIYLLNSSFLI